MYNPQSVWIRAEPFLLFAWLKEKLFHHTPTDFHSVHMTSSCVYSGSCAGIDSCMVICVDYHGKHLSLSAQTLCHTNTYICTHMDDLSQPPRTQANNINGKHTYIYNYMLKGVLPYFIQVHIRLQCMYVCMYLILVYVYTALFLKDLWCSKYYKIYLYSTVALTAFKLFKHRSRGYLIIITILIWLFCRLLRNR